MEPRKHLSWSAINDFLLCPESYRLSRVERIRTPFGPAGFVGTLAHAVFEVNYSQKVTSGNDLPVDELTDRFAEGWERTCDCGHLRAEHTDVSGTFERCEALARHRGRLCDCIEYRPGVQALDWRFDQPEPVKNAGIAAIRAHREHLSPRIQPAVVEEQFNIPLGDDFPYDLMGFIDLITVERKIVDLKFYSDFGYKKLEKEIGADGQMDLYACAYRVARGEWEAGLEIAATNKISGATKMVPTSRTNEQIQWRLRQVEAVGRAIVAGAFPARTDSFRHSPRWCGHWDRCMKGLQS